jgi:hypothetical protein
MAYPVSKATVQHNGNATELAITLPTHAVNDLLVIFLAQDGGGTTIAAKAGTTGWTVRNPASVSGAARGAIAYKYVTSAPETTPTFTGTASEAWSAITVVVRDADATTPINATSGTGYVSVDFTTNPTASGALTTGAGDAGDGALLLYGWAFDGASTYGRALSNDLIELGKDVGSIDGDQTINQIVGYRVQDAAGAAPTISAYATATAEGGTGWVIAIKNAASGSRAEDCRTGVVEGIAATTGVNWYGDFGAAHKAVTWTKPSDFAATINSISAYTSLATGGVSTAGGNTYTWGRYTTLIEDDNLTTTFAGVPAWTGGTHTCTSTDMSGKVFALQWYLSVGSQTPSLGADGVIVGFKDAGGDWVCYQLRPKALIVPSSEISTQIALGQATIYAASDGTGAAMDWTTVSAVGFFIHRLIGATATHSLGIKNAVLLGSAVISGGSSSLPCSFTTLTTAMESWGLGKLADLQASAQVMAKGSVQIGDGASNTYFDSSAQSFSFPKAYSSLTQPEWNCNANQLSLTINASADDTINLAACGVVTTTSQALTVDAASSTSAAYSFVGTSIIGVVPTDNAGLGWSNVVFKNCGTLTIAGGGDMTNCSISLTTSSQAPLTITANGSTIASSTISCVMESGANAAHHIALGASVTSITMNGNTLSGTAGTDKIYSALASGTLTITWDGNGTSLVAGDVTFVGGSTANAVVAAPTVNQVVVVSGITVGARVQIYDTTSSTELFNGTASAGDTVVSGSTVTWTDPAAASASRAIRVRVAYVSGATAKEFIEVSGLTCGTTSGTESVTYPVSPTDDTVYNANGENGATIYGGGEITFVDASPDRVDMNMTAATLSLQKQYAAWAYYAFTATGIATDIDYINAIDTANYEFTNIRWKNTATAPATLTITGGYAWDSSTGLAITLVDTSGGTIFLMPDHVVAYATGSGVTAQDVADIAAASATSTTTAVLAAAQTTPIHADVRKVYGIAIDGAGTEADPWGPV